MLKLKDCWAKTEPFQSISTHAIISGQVAQILYSSILSDSERELLRHYCHCSDCEVMAFLGYLTSLHDIGKTEGKFQQKQEQMKELLQEQNLLQFVPPAERIRHEKTSYKAVETIWRKQGEDRRAAKLFAQILGAHHQGKAGQEGNCNHPVWCELQDELEKQMREFFHCPTLPELDGSSNAPLAALLLGVVILSDWIASSEEFSDSEDWIDDDSADRIIDARMKKFLTASGLLPVRTHWGKEFYALWPNIPRTGIRPLQEATEMLFSESAERFRVVLMEAPMGEGKTEAGMYAAIQMMQQWGKDGFYMALPTAATSNQMVGRMREMLGMNDVDCTVRLLHAMAWLSESIPPANSEDESTNLSQWLAPSRRALLGQYAVGTVDQAMLAATNVKYGVLRLLGLANKVLIIDEIHSYDVYMTEIILRLLSWCKALDIPVVMLSATLPPALKEKLLKPYGTGTPPQSYPAITAISESGEIAVRHIDRTVKQQEVIVKTAPFLKKPDEIARLAVEQVSGGGCICVLMNTVKDAQKVYQAVKRIFDGEAMLFHAQFPAAQRDRIEKSCIEKFGKDKSRRPKRSILVATQVVEQSLDVDFDAMITAVAPIDLLIQRMGRVFRHDDTLRPSGNKMPLLRVLLPEDGETFGVNECIYPKCLLQQSMHLLKERSCVRIPEDLAQLVAEGYDPALARPEEAEAWLDMMMENSSKASAGQIYMLSPPDKAFSPCAKNDPLFRDDEDDSFLSVKTRLGEPTLRIALLDAGLYKKIREYSRLVDGREMAVVFDSGLAKAVMEQSVSVAKKCVERLLSAPDAHGIRGSGLLAGVEILLAEKGSFECSGGWIKFDPELGVIIKEGAEKNGQL